MQQLQLVAYGEPSDVIELNRVPEPALGQEDVLVSMEAAPINPSDFMLVRGIYYVRPAFPFPVGAEGVGRVIQTGSKVDGALRGRRVLILPTYEQGTWADQVVVPARNVVPMSDDADPLQLSMIGVNPATAYLLLNRYASLMPGDWIGQTAANSAMGQYILKLRVRSISIVLRYQGVTRVSVMESCASVSASGLSRCCRTTSTVPRACIRPMVIPRPSDGFVQAHESPTLTIPVATGTPSTTKRR
jgi:D-arabinose 1-dehydrogenase-like Zn-dependent alcohol dehydrogenase